VNVKSQPAQLGDLGPNERIPRASVLAGQQAITQPGGIGVGSISSRST
jgi:hypothetical protein